jgi:hypothetical protein
MDVSETMSTCLRRLGLIQDKTSLSEPIQGYPGGFKVIWAEPTLSAPFQDYPWRFKVIHEDSRLSIRNQDCLGADKEDLPRIKLIWRG